MVVEVSHVLNQLDNFDLHDLWHLETLRPLFGMLQLRAFKVFYMPYTYRSLGSAICT